jgi:hypothetical protein
MAIDTTRILGEEGLIGTVVNSSLSTTGLTVYAQFRDAKTGAARTPDAGTLMFVIDKDNERFEIIQADSHSTASGITTITINASGRALPRYGTGAGSGTGLAHDIGASIGSVILARPLNELAAQAVAKAGDTMTAALGFSGTTHEGIKPISLTTAQRTALTPATTAVVYDTDIGEYYVWQGGAWSAVSSGSTQPNASTTVAGKVELATAAERAAGTATGGTGAALIPTNDALVKTSSGAADENKIPVLNASGQLADGFISTTVPVTTTVFSAPAGEAVDGSVTPQMVCISDGTNGKTAGAFYKADANDWTNLFIRGIGFVNVNASSVGSSYNIITEGTVTGFAGLTPGQLYYLDSTAGGIVTSPPASSVAFPVGVALNATTLQIKKGKKMYSTTVTRADNAAGETYYPTITLGFSPTKITCLTWQNGFSSTASTGEWQAGQSYYVTSGFSALAGVYYGYRSDSTLGALFADLAADMTVTITVNSVSQYSVQLSIVQNAHTAIGGSISLALHIEGE